MTAIDQQIVESRQRVFAASEFVAQAITREPDLLDSLVHQNKLLGSYVEGELAQLLRQYLVQVDNKQQLYTALRQFRRYQMVRIIWRDLAGWATLGETFEDLSALADACVVQALDLLHAWQVQELGCPEDNAGKSQQLIVLAMGKLGARELNLSSDIDLIFAFTEHGVVRTASGKNSKIDSSQFFQRLAQQLVYALQQILPEGFVFRVDTRLRPFGDSGPLVCNLRTLEDY
ncbi:hypothetical protein TI03_02720 [Achromatium sp. WMS1]|nr:hypothetical protein TI03_02720 [Achromatium sp. WMS1]